MGSTKIYSGKKYGYGDREYDFETELEALCDIAPEAYVVHDLEVNDDGDWFGTMVIRFGADKIGEGDLSQFVDMLNTMIEKDEGEPCYCRECEGSEYDVTVNDMTTLGEELKKAVDDFGKLIEALSKKD